MSPSYERAVTLLQRHPLVDGHNDLAWALREQVGYDLDRADVGTRLSTTHTDLTRMREGHVGAQFWSVYSPSSLAGSAAVTVTLEQIDFVRRMIDAYPDHLRLALTADDVCAAFTAGRVASLIGAEGGHSIGCSMGTLRTFYALGVRYMTLTHNDNVAWADSATDEPRIGGLSEFGRAVVAEMNRLGMLVDLSHVSPNTMCDALEASAAPAIFSHSCCRALVDHPRNVPDDVLGRLADDGGVCMVAFVPDFVSSECAAWSARLKDDMTRRGLDTRDWHVWMAAAVDFAAIEPRPVATVADVVDHVEHVRDVAGIDHVGVGADYDGCDAFPAGLEDVTGYPRLFAELLDRGWSEGDCAKVAGGNLLRVLREAESVATRLRRERGASLATISTLDGALACDLGITPPAREIRERTTFQASADRR